MFEIKKFPEFSWSFSRHKTLMDCSRKYGYEYYIAHNGWLSYGVDPLSKQAYRLKKLLNLPILFGQITHEIADSMVKEYLKSRYIPVENELIEKGRLMLRNAFIHSRDKKELWYDKPNKYKMFFEMYYDGNLEKEKAKEYRERLDIVFPNLLKSKAFQDITIRHNTMRFNQSEEFRFMVIDDVKIFVVMDLLYRDIKEGKWIIVDWKTGRESDDDRNQLALYAYYLMQQFNIGVEEIEIRNEYLLKGTQKSYTLSNTDINSMLERMKSSILYMKRYQLDILTNEPIALEEFEQTDHLKYCKSCNYKEMCNREDNKVC
ncbi:PD-(D/E)XK nuclease family protein [Bacillus cereus]|uniref:PD-(D/E)XK nuclease family protein n=1 Tax=Bacillus cereus TaxID=1396 RepID=UPI0012B6A60F|nr:PD-(D/E)XK nuclease family protein [Bacillus cereus]